MEKFIPDENGLVTVQLETLHELLDDLDVPRTPSERSELEDDSTPFTLEERMVVYQEMLEDEMHLLLKYEKRMIDRASKYLKFSRQSFEAEQTYRRLLIDIEELRKEYDQLQEEAHNLKLSHPEDR